MGAVLARAYSEIPYTDPAPATDFQKNRKKIQASKALQKEMLTPASEALSQSILAEISAATTDYTTNVELDVAPEGAARVRKSVTDILTRQGYSGVYPHFKKMSSLQGIRLLEVQEQPAFVRNEKHMACMIDCFEAVMHGGAPGGDAGLVLNCAVSTVFLKPDELDLFDSLDGRSEFFPHKQRRRQRILAPRLSAQDDTMSYDLESFITIAAKTAQCEKFDKGERAKVLDIATENSKPMLIISTILFALFSGIIFALLFCPAIFLLTLGIGYPLIAALESEPLSFPEYFYMLCGFPWWQMFLFCVIGFGGLFAPIMTFINTKAQRCG